MSKKLLCENCGKFLGEVERGLIHRKLVCLCATCWSKALSAINTAESAIADLPDFMKGVFDKP